jgi:hypothetical protein
LQSPSTTIALPGAELENSVAELLRLLLRGEFKAAEAHPAISLLRAALCGGGFEIPVLDIVAVLPVVGSSEMNGFHIASYEGCGAGDDWYPKLLEEFFSAGIGGSLLALEDYSRYVGSCRVLYGAGNGRVTHGGVLIPKASHFPPKPRTIKYSVEERFAEYAEPLLKQITGPAAVAWLCFGPSDEHALEWSGSVFVTIRSNSAEAEFTLPSGTLDKVYAILNAALYRTIVDSGYREETAHRLEQTYFAFGHDLKNRLDTIGMKEFRESVRNSAPQLLREANECYERFEVLSGLCGVFRAAAKLENGVLPGAWIGSANGPGSTGYKPNKRDFSELNASLKNAVAVFIKIEDPNDELIVRHVNGSSVRKIARPDSYHVMLPQFSAKTTDPHLCFLSGLAELCRNAARAALAADGDLRHVDFTLEITEGFVATVTLYNPLVGTNSGASKSIELLAQLFRRFNSAVEFVQAELIETYEHRRNAGRYVRSRFIYFPMRLQFERRTL